MESEFTLRVGNVSCYFAKPKVKCAGLGQKPSHVFRISGHILLSLLLGFKEVIYSLPFSTWGNGEIGRHTSFECLQNKRLVAISYLQNSFLF